MKCPVCTGLDLKIAERQGVEIDYCPECRGVWLDRGELDKILERSNASSNTLPPTGPQAYRGDLNQRYHEDEHHNGHGYKEHGLHKRKSWLTELFD